MNVEVLELGDLELGLENFDPKLLLRFGGGVWSSLAMNFPKGFRFLDLDFGFLEA